MNIERLPSGSYRIRQTYKGKRYYVTFDHKPTQKEIMQEISKIVENRINEDSKTFKRAAELYIESKGSVLSVSTIKGYKSMLYNLPESFLGTMLKDIDTFTVQELISTLQGKGRSPKYIRNINGFITPVLSMFCPSTSINVTLPRKTKKETYNPTDEDIKKILKASKGSPYECNLYLAAYGLRRSEAAAVTSKDLKGNKLSINKAKVLNSQNEWVIKNSNKTDESTREIYVSDYVAKMIKKDNIYRDDPHKMLDYLYSLQNELGIPRFTLHTMRHYFASKMSLITDEATVLKLGGWKSDHVMKSVYRYAMNDQVEQAK